MAATSALDGESLDPCRRDFIVFSVARSVALKVFTYTLKLGFKRPKGSCIGWVSAFQTVLVWGATLMSTISPIIYQLESQG
ncbi:uncharacterized protein BDCG_02974 [Blastomyces dermatitidis ER-3]|uniref:Uncharacterized protein n=1 Tax=Ajellomyces dermatitidis (strain ER-3 / ATCC MYA-2586) TaxID=559297 RepID=A0ABP2EV80_AJEDR|nr:uncharacterized protein BDCG_02974 [Blastomyces dermatitidis ER-3]EEQ87854.2 hypothetical protein BDCG_02974 [Blastomyces dermatitidis ER-3]